MNARPESLVARLQGMVADVLELVQVRLELLTIEAREDLRSLVSMAAVGALAIVMVSFGLIFLALFLTVLLWDSQRLLPLGVFTALFLVGGLVGGAWVWAKARNGLRMFSASLSELRRDQQRIRS